jgi:hypothetical protein
MKKSELRKIIKEELLKENKYDDKKLVWDWYKLSFGKDPDNNDDYLKEWTDRLEKRGIYDFMAHMTKDRRKDFLEVLKETFKV